MGVLDPKHFQDDAAATAQLEEGIHEEYAAAMQRVAERHTAPAEAGDEKGAMEQSAALRAVCGEAAGWSDLLGGSGAIFSKTTEGAAPNARRAEYAGRARVHIEGRLLLLPEGDSGSLFFSSETADAAQETEGLRVRIGDDDHPLVPPGLMLGVRMMAEGQSCVVRCAAKFGYGSSGWNGVPPDSALEYRVRMLECLPASAPVSELQAAIERKELGNMWFRAGRYPRASRCYSAGLQIVGDVSVPQAEGDSNEATAMLEVAVALGNNHYLAEEKLGNLRAAKEALIGVLIRDPANLKALLAAARLGISPPAPPPTHPPTPSACLLVGACFCLCLPVFICVFVCVCVCVCL